MAHTVFLPGSDEERAEMLHDIGVASVEDLFASVPAGMQTSDFNLPAGLSEMEMLRELRRLASRQSSVPACFCGAGFYDHFIPAAVDALSSRGEFLTAYTPYQAEASQGTLQAIYEYQTAIVRLTGMEVANASVYDGGTALFEGLMMAVRATRRSRVLVDEGVHPVYRAMLRSFTRSLPLECREIPTRDGLADRRRIESELDGETAAVLLQNPNFFGRVDDFSDLASAAGRAGALSVVSTYPISLGCLKTPGEMGADIATGEGQSLGLPLSFGGPYLGFMAVRRELARRLPGRIVGMTEDARKRRGFVLTLQAREQHIRREKATSNICTNEALCALRAVIYLSLLGRRGLVETAERCAAAAGYARERLLAIPGVEPYEPGPFFNEFALRLPRHAGEVVAQILRDGIAAGFPVGRYAPGLDRVLLVAVTEKRTAEEIDRLADSLKNALC